MEYNYTKVYNQLTNIKDEYFNVINIEEDNAFVSFLVLYHELEYKIVVDTDMNIISIECIYKEEHIMDIDYWNSYCKEHYNSDANSAEQLIILSAILRTTNSYSSLSYL